MDIYQIIITHNRSWTIREIIAFAVVFLMAVFLAAVLLRLHKIVIIQAVCGLLLLTFFAIVFGLLNILLLFPAGILLPGVTGRKLKWWMGLLVGIAVSSAIEISQLLLCRGLFEFDDIIHNSLGCMLGSLLGNRMLRLVHGK